MKKKKYQAISDIRNTNLLVIAVVFLLLFILCVSLCSFYMRFEKTSESIHAKTAYRLNWGITIGEEYKEKYYAETDHGAFGEGYRFSVLFTEGAHKIAVPQQPPYMDHFTREKISGSGHNDDVRKMVENVWEQLEIPAEHKYHISESNWSVILDDHSHSFVVVFFVWDTNIVCLAEKLT